MSALFSRLRSAVATLTVLTATALATTPASAQSFWDWGGGSTVGGSGREVVSFNPSHAPGQIIVSFTDRRLYHITSRGQAVSYPVATPRDQSRWQGVMSVTQKRENPSWTPTATMRRENPRLPAFVPGGHPMNPMGVRALYLGSSMYRIHGTDAPWTIGQPVSKGCIRMYNQDVIDLYSRVPVGTRVTVTYQSFQTGQGGYSTASTASSFSGSSNWWDSDSEAEEAPPRQKRRVYRRQQRSVSVE